jgi:hypothetical protein
VKSTDVVWRAGIFLFLTTRSRAAPSTFPVRWNGCPAHVNAGPPPCWPTCSRSGRVANGTCRPPSPPTMERNARMNSRTIALGKPSAFVFA